MVSELLLKRITAVVLTLTVSAYSHSLFATSDESDNEEEDYSGDCYDLGYDDGTCRVVIRMDPFGSFIDGDGEYCYWVGFEKAPFQSILKEYGMDNYIQDKWFLRDKILQLLYANYN